MIQWWLSITTASVLLICSVAWADDPPPAGFPPYTAGVNMSAGDISDPYTVTPRLTFYLGWLDAQQFKRQARIICPAWRVEYVDQFLMPRYEAHGWQVTCVVGQEPSEMMTANLHPLRWFIAKWGPSGRNVLFMIEPANEPWHPGHKTKKSLLIWWHREVAKIARENGLPVAAGYFGDSYKDRWKYYKEACQKLPDGTKDCWDWDKDVDVIAINTTESSGRKAMRYVAKKLDLSRFKIICTECDYRHINRLKAETGRDWDAILIYTCNGEDSGKSGLNRCPPAPDLPPEYREGFPE